MNSSLSAKSIDSTLAQIATSILDDNGQRYVFPKIAIRRIHDTIEPHENGILSVLE